jgi:hypothetical protein
VTNDEKLERLARYLFSRQSEWRSLCSPEDADWDEWVERNQDEWRAEADELLAFIDEVQP